VPLRSGCRFSLRPRDLYQGRSVSVLGDDTDQSERRAWGLGNQLEGEEGLKRKGEVVELLRDVVSYQPDDLSRSRLASALGDLAFNLVLNNQFAEARIRCEEAQRLANEIGDGVQKKGRDDLIFIQVNLAHALFFQGHYDEALAIYRKYWDKPLQGKTFGEITLEDSPDSIKRASPIPTCPE
jgi:tetratricopeptide (TPR) repeat protein